MIFFLIKRIFLPCQLSKPDFSSSLQNKNLGSKTIDLGAFLDRILVSFSLVLRFLGPYNARLTREAVAPIRLAWKGQANRGSGATFADKTTLLDPRAKGVTATLSRC
jgi:hypothetical protein